MSIKENLKTFYDHEAKKYASSRQKHRADARYILEEIKKHNKKNINILEFGCGGGRLLEYLGEIENIQISYTGVDLSVNLINIAKKNSPKGLKCNFICDDIVNYIKILKQESFDFVIGTASFQHLPTNTERLIVLKNSYRILTYGGKLIMTNRALSLRFIKKHKKQIVNSLLKSLITLGKHTFRDLFVPRTSEHKTFKRYYHFFSLQELKKLLELSGFIIQSLSYIDKQGKKTKDWKYANNSLTIAKKDTTNTSL